ncbi:MAG: ABC transporter ATP-binding protein [Spirochaetota bacterium]
MSQIITVSHLVKNYTANRIAVPAIRGISLSIDEGEFSAIAGPSGSGKTTLLNIIGALDSPTKGTVSVAGKDLADLSRRELADIRRDQIGFIFQAYNLIPVLSARENVEYILLLQGIAKQERKQRAEQILEEVGLADQLSRLPKDMFGGQQQRVAVARAIVSRPRIILADEPTANLDQKTGAALIDLMHRLSHRRKMTFLFSTHDPMVMDYAERLIYIRDGKIESDRRKKGSHKVKG